jgi:alcohol dehydrogenase
MRCILAVEAAQMSTTTWSHHNPLRVLAGPGCIERLPELVPPSGRLLLVTSPGFARRGLAAGLAAQLGSDRVCLYAEAVPNPDLDALDAAAEKLSGQDFATVIGLGGGSALDAAKVLAAAIGLSPRPLHRCFRLKEPTDWSRGLPIIAVPTTSGTGAEATPFATVWDTAGRKKFSLAGPGAMPQAALLDPTLTLSLPEDQTLYPGLDVMSHALESLWNRNRTPVSEALAAKSLELALDALPEVLAHPADMNARAAMQQASLLAGMAISQTRTAIAHSMSYPLTLRFGVPHGLACSFTLARVIGLYLAQRPRSPWAGTMRRAEALLRGLGLHDRLARFAGAEQIAALTGEMVTAGRADNFDGELPNLAELLARP